MRRFLRVMTWLALGFGFLLLLAVIGVTIYTRTEGFTRWVREEGVTAVNGLIRGSVSVERLEGSVWRHLVLHNVGLRYEEHEILTVPRLDVSFSLLPLQGYSSSCRITLHLHFIKTLSFCADF